jgi:hypothetical protein
VEAKIDVHFASSAAYDWETPLTLISINLPEIGYFECCVLLRVVFRVLGLPAF